jgi:hypothetical protein
MSAFGGKPEIEAKLLTKDEARRIAAKIGNGVNYWAVSDLAASKLEDFAQLFRATPRGIVEGGMKKSRRFRAPGRRPYME